MADCVTSVAKFLVFFFNFLFSLIGIVIAALGVIIQTQLIDFKVLPKDLSVYPIVLIVVGCVIFLISFLGCCGAITENRCMLLSFSIIMSVLLLGEIGLGIAAYEKRSWLEEIVEQGLNDTLQSIKTDPSLREHWYKVQYDLKCCGVNGPDDWTSITGGLPPSCCQQPEGTICLKPDASKTGCKVAFINFLKDHMVAAVAAVFAVLTFQLIGIIFSCCLFSVFRQKAE